MPTLTLLELRNRAYQLMDEGQSQYLSVAEMNNYINNAASSLHNIVANSDPWRMKVETSFPLVPGTDAYSVPDDLHSLLRVFYVTSGGLYTPLKSYNPSQFRRSTNAPCGGAPVRYYLMGSKIRLDPAPKSPLDGVMVWYVPQYSPLVVDTDTLPTYQLQGFEQWIINGAVIYAKAKEEVLSDDLQLMNAQLMTQIEKSLWRRDANSGNRILDNDEPLESWYH